MVSAFVFIREVSALHGNRDFSCYAILNALPEFAGRVVLVAVLLGGFGCSELRARQHAREGNQYFRQGKYSAAIAAYSAAEELHPLPVVAFNKGLACRQLMLPGAKTRETERAVECALSSFARLKELDPDDTRADQLYQQTLFDADRFASLVKIYSEQLRAEPNDRAAMNALIQAYARWGRWDEARRWTIERAKRRPRDAEAQYAVGVLIYNRLFDKGGGVEKSAFDPRLPATKLTPPAFADGDIAGSQRVTLAEQGTEFLKKALEIRPGYADAMTYLGLLYRQKSFAFFEQVTEWQSAVDSAEIFRKQATLLHAEQAAKQPSRER